jgi:hypothetical protein
MNIFTNQKDGGERPKPTQVPNNPRPSQVPNVPPPQRPKPDTEEKGWKPPRR